MKLSLKLCDIQVHGLLFNRLVYKTKYLMQGFNDTVRKKNPQCSGKIVMIASHMADLNL